MVQTPVEVRWKNFTSKSGCASSFSMASAIFSSLGPSLWWGWVTSLVTQLWCYTNNTHTVHMCTLPVHIWAMQRCRDIPPVSPPFAQPHAAHTQHSSLAPGCLVQLLHLGPHSLLQCQKIHIHPELTQECMLHLLKDAESPVCNGSRFCLPAAVWEFYLQWQ